MTNNESEHVPGGSAEETATEKRVRVISINIVVILLSGVIGLGVLQGAPVFVRELVFLGATFLPIGMMMLSLMLSLFLTATRAVDNLVQLAPAIVLTFVLGFGVFYFQLDGSMSDRKEQIRESTSNARLAEPVQTPEEPKEIDAEDYGLVVSENVLVVRTSPIQGQDDQFWVSMMEFYAQSQYHNRIGFFNAKTKQLEATIRVDELWQQIKQSQKLDPELNVYLWKSEQLTQNKMEFYKSEGEGYLVELQCAGNSITIKQISPIHA